MAKKSLELTGDFVSLCVDQKKNLFLDGFWRHDEKRQPVLLLFVHGMYSNFYHSQLKKALMSRCVKAGFDLFSFNNRGAENDVKYERFEDCLKDIDTALGFGRKKGYKKFILLGHSTGCQKITFYQARRKDRQIVGIGLLAPGDDYAIMRRAAGASFTYWVNKAKKLVAEGEGDTLLPATCSGFSAKRYLSVADPSRTESKVFNYEGRLYHFQQVRCAVLLLFGDAEQYACLPVKEMHEILRDKAKTSDFEEHIIPGADHSFHGCEQVTARRVLAWASRIS